MHKAGQKPAARHLALTFHQCAVDSDPAPLMNYDPDFRGNPDFLLPLSGLKRTSSWFISENIKRQAEGLPRAKEPCRLCRI